MQGRADGNVLERMCDVIGASEEWLLDRLVASVREGGLGRTPRMEPTWRDSVRGLSDAVFQAVYAVPFGYAEGTVGTDPVVAFGMLRGRRHRANGVRSADWHALMRHHRAAYVGLIESSGFDEDEEEVCRFFLQGVFDRFERGFAKGYEEVPESSSGFSPAPSSPWPAPWSIAEDAGGTVF
jgi:hypothetical protein